MGILSVFSEHLDSRIFDDLFIALWGALETFPQQAIEVATGGGVKIDERNGKKHLLIDNEKWPFSKKDLCEILENRFPEQEIVRELGKILSDCLSFCLFMDNILTAAPPMPVAEGLPAACDSCSFSSDYCDRKQCGVG